MQRHTPRSILLRAALCSAILAPLPTMTACESSQLGNLLNSPTAMDLLSPLVKDAANSYIANLTDLTSMLSDINSLQGVLSFIENIQPTIDQIRSAYNTLASTTPEERRLLWEAFGPKLRDANSSFLNQSEELTDNSSWSRLLNPVLDRVELFQ
jgi:hypothetical protein